MDINNVYQDKFLVADFRWKLDLILNLTINEIWLQTNIDTVFNVFVYIFIFILCIF